MPLHGKLVVIKRSGGDGTEFPLTATCLFGRKSDCDIRIQLPQVSKEHCRIDLNENKEIILTNLSSSCPTCVNGEPLLQSERLKHGDVITVFDRSFRFEYPPAPTPKKRPAKTETLKVLQDQQVGDTVATETGEKTIPDVSTDPHLKDGANHDNIQRSLEKTVEVDAQGDDSLLQSKTTSPFSDLYQMIKQSLDVKTPRKSSASVIQTPASRICTPGSIRKNDRKPAISTEDKSTPKKVSPAADETKEEAENVSYGTPKSVKKQRRSFQVPSAEVAGPEADEAAKSAATPLQRRSRTPPKRFTACEVIEQISTTPPVRRRSKEAKPAVTKEQEEQAAASPKTRTASPRNSGKVEKVKEMSKKRKSEELAADLPKPQTKKKRVSFGGFLCPELFDKRLPPDSPLRKGATPRRSLCGSKPKFSLLRRASDIGLLQNKKERPGSPKMRTPSPKKSSSSKNASPKTPTPKKTTPKSRSPSPKAATPVKKSPKSRSPSPKAATPVKKSPKSRSPSPKAATPVKKSPKSRSPSPKAATPAKKSPKPRTPSPKAATPANKSPKSRSASPKTPTSKPRTPSLKAATPAKKSPKSKSPSPARGRSPTVGRTSGVQTPKVQGRFSVSLISTPSPVAEDAVTEQVSLVTVTPKITQRRKSTSRESTVKSAAKVMRRRSGISRASMKAKNSWADIVRFGQTKAQVVAPAKKNVTKKTTKKTVPKPQTPARRLKGLVSTGHADSPVSIVVGRAHKLKVVHPTGAAPKLVTNVALFKRNMKMDEDLTGISEMLKTPVNPKRRRSVINVAKTPSGTSVVEPSVLNTPEEPGEMMVSPLSSTVKDRSYNSEAVKRLLDDDEEPSFVSDSPALDESSEQQSTDLKTTSVTTPKQKPELPQCLTGVKRIMKTPKQKAEPVEDLRGKILKTPKQKPVQQECLTGVKRIMRTPKQKAEPVEDLRGKILKTPKQKPQQQECLTGVKRIMKTPKQKAEPVEDLRGKILKTPKQKPEQLECLSGVKKMMETPRRGGESVEDVKVELLTAPKQMPEQQESLTEVETPQQEAEPFEDLQEKTLETPEALEAGDGNLHDVEEHVETPAPEEESVDQSEITDVDPKEKTPGSTSDVPVEDLEGPEDLMEEPVTEATGQLETNEVADQTPSACDEDVAKVEADANEVVVDDHLEEVPSGHDESSDAMETVSEAAVYETVSEEQPKVDTADEKVPEELSEVDTVEEDVSEEQLQVDTVDEVVSEERPKVDAVDQDASEEQPKNETVEEVVSEEQPKEETVDEVVSEEQPKEETVDEVVSEEQPKQETVEEVVSEEQPKEETVNEVVSEEQPKEEAVDEVVSEEQPKEEAIDEVVSEGQPKVDTEEDVSEEQPKVDTMDDVSEEQPQVETVDEVVSEEQPKVDTMDDDVSEEQPQVETVDEVVSEEQPKVDTVDDDVSEEQPKEEAVDEVVSEEQPKVDTEEEDVSEEQPKEETVDEVVSEEQPKVDTVDDDVSEEQPQVETVDEVVSEEQPQVETVDEVVSEEKVPEDQLQVETVTGSVTEMDTATTDAVPEKKPVRGRRAKTAEDKQEAAEQSEDPVIAAPVRGRRGKKTEAAAPPAVRKATRGRNAKSQESTSDDQPELDPENAVETLVAEVSSEAVSDQTSPVEEDDSAAPAEEAVVKPVRGRKTKQTPVEPPQPEPEKKEAVSDAQPEKSAPALVKPRRGRKTKADTVEQNEVVEDAVVTVETKQQSQPPVRAKRGRNAKQVEEPVETTTSKEPATKLRRTRKAEQASEDQAEMIQEVETEMVPEPDSEQSSPVEVEQEAPLEKAVPKPKRGRKAKQQSLPEQQDMPSSPSEDAPPADTATEVDANEVCSDQLEVVASGSDENKSSDVTETAHQTSVTESLPEVETATCEVTETVAAVVQKKPVRGRRAKTAEDKQEAAEQSEDPVIAAPVRGRRGKKTEAAAPPAVRKATRGRNAKSQESTSDDQPELDPENAVETLVTEVSSEAVSDQTSPVEEDDSAAPAEEAVVKPVRGRKTKQTPVEPPQPEKKEVVSDEPLVEEVQPEKSVPVLVKPKRGKKTKADTVEQNEVVEDVVVAVETKQQSQPPVRAKRGRNAKPVEEPTSAETTKSQELATKLRRTRKAEQDQEEAEMVAPEEAEAPVDAEPVKVNEPAVKPKRGGRKAKQDPESETPVEEAPAVSSTDKRGRRGKQVTQEVAVTVVEPEEKPEELEAPVIKQSRARGAKTAAKNEVSVPVKRARRGAAPPPEETNTESTDMDSEPSVEPAKRGRQAAAKTTEEEDTETSKKSVKWKADLEDAEVVKATPVKAARGRKTKLGDTENKNVSKDADKAEEKDLSDNVVEAPPVKRARRGAKVADKAEVEVEHVEADAAPKTRRGRTARK